MSGIGDYIHYHYINYMRYGINKTDGSQPPIWNIPAYFNGVKTRLIKQIKAEANHETYDKAKIQNELDTLQNLMEEVQNVNSRKTAVKEFQQEYLKSIEEVFNKSAGQAITLAGQAITKREKINYTKVQKNALTYIKNFDANKTTGSIEVNTLYKLLTSFNKLISINGNDGNEIGQIINSYYDTIITELKDLTGHSLKSLINSGNRKGFKNAVEPITGKNGIPKSTIKDILDMIALAKSAISYNYSQITGTHGEALTELMTSVLGYTGNKEINKIENLTTEEIKTVISKIKLGKGEGGKVNGIYLNPGVEINTQLIKIDDKELERYFKNNDGTVEIRMGQQKVDLTLNLKKDNEVGLSIKNYNLSNNTWITLVNRTPLTTILFDQGENFTNHFLNVYNKHETSHGKSFKDVGVRYIAEQLDIAIDVLRLLGYKTALEGVGVRQKAKYILINDNSTGRVRIIGVKELLKRAMELQESDNAGMNFHINNYNIRQLRVKDLPSNKWGNKEGTQGVQERITKLVAEAHAQKVHIALNPVMIRNNYFK